MSAVALLELDVDPPAVATGQVASAGGLLLVPYTLDEPELLDATFIAGPQTLTAAVLPDRVEVATTSRSGRLDLHVRDAVGNEAITPVAISLPDVNLLTATGGAQRDATADAGQDPSVSRAGDTKARARSEVTRDGGATAGDRKEGTT